jgi:hypothetical protein
MRGGTAWSPESRLKRLRASHSYGFVLVLVVVSFLYVAAAPTGIRAQSVLVLIQTATLIVALMTSGLGRDRRPAFGLVVIGIVLAVYQLVVGEDQAAGLVAIIDFLIVISTCVVIGIGVVDQRTVNKQSVLGAISIYVLIGMFFVYVYGAVAWLGSGDFFAQGTDGTPSLRLYFSYVTLATLGYGDYTPSGTLGHTLAVVEALVGQLYLVTVVALLVGNLVQARHGST